jgi:hypothetical protein
MAHVVANPAFAFFLAFAGFAGADWAITRLLNRW